MRANKITASDSLKEKSRKAFDNQAFSYDTDMRGVHARELYPYVLDEVIKKAIDISSPSLLDLGCGTGALSKMVLDEIPYCTLSCVDYSTEMVKVAKNRLGSKVDVVLGDVESLPFHDSTFDIAWCNDSFYHYPDPEKAIFQMWRVLKSGGEIIVGDVWQSGIPRAIMNAWMPFSSEGDVKIYSESELRGLFSKWFNEVSWRRIGNKACILVARKL